MLDKAAIGVVSFFGIIAALLILGLALVLAIPALIIDFSCKN